MLILTRRIGESLVIGDEVTVTILGIKGKQIRIGVSAPESISINREEIHNQIHRTQENEFDLTEIDDVKENEQD